MKTKVLLSGAELRVATQLAYGNNITEIAAKLGISEIFIKACCNSLRVKFKLKTNNELTALLNFRGIITLIAPSK